MNHPLPRLLVTLSCALAAASAHATCAPPNHEMDRSPTGDWDAIYGQPAGIVSIYYQGQYSDTNCMDAAGTLGGPGDTRDRFQIKLTPDPYYGGVFTQVYWYQDPKDGVQGGVNQGTFLSISRVDAPDLPIFTVDASTNLSPKFMIGSGTYVVTVQTDQLHYADGTPGQYAVRFNVEQVPEPATVALWLGGLAFVAGAAWRRRAG